MLLLPAIDLKDGCCVRLSQGLKDSVKVYSENPLEIAHRWYHEGAEMLHLVNLDGAFHDDDAKISRWRVR